MKPVIKVTLAPRGGSFQIRRLTGAIRISLGEGGMVGVGDSLTEREAEAFAFDYRSYEVTVQS